MRIIDIIIAILFTPAALFMFGYLYLNERHLCPPMNTHIYCFGISALAEFILIPFVVLCSAIGAFFLCRRLGTEHI